MSRPRRVCFVCSSALHVELFAPTIRRVASIGRLQPIIVSLDKFYAGIHGNVTACAEELQLPAVIVDAGFGRGDRDGGLMARIFAAQGAGMRAMVALLNDGGTGLVVLGNDTGHAERVVITAARSLGVPTLLVQDGFLFDQFPAGFSGTLRLTLRRLWLSVGGNRLGWVPYGMGGCDAIAVHGIGWLETICRGKSHATRRIVVTGHPVLTSPDDHLVSPVAGSDVLFFCSNFLSAFKDAAAHQDQVGQILALQKLLMARYGENAALHVKLHPADRLEDYAALTGLSGITLHKDTVLDNLIRKSWLCVTNISSVSLNCLVAGRVCLMSGISLKRANYRRLFANLPGTKFVTWDAFCCWLDRLDSVGGYARVLAMQGEGLETWIGEPGQGTERLAALIDELASADAVKGNV
jgi:hypothetical protein